MSTPVRKKTPHSILKSRMADENKKHEGTPLSQLKTNIKSSTSSPKTPFTPHNKMVKSPAAKQFVRTATPKTMPGNQARPSALKSKGFSMAPTTPKQQSSTSSKASTPRTAKIFKSPSKGNTPVTVENSVLVQFSKDIFTNVDDCTTPTRPVKSLSEESPGRYMFDRLNRSHSASSLFCMKKKNEETPKAALKRSLSEAKISLDSSIETEGEKSSLTVGVRIRPLLPREGMNSIHVSNGVIKVASDLGSEHSFTYDHCFPVTSTQEEVYTALVQPLLDKAFQGYNACLFAYGQTGSGKTYSMTGPFGEEGEEPCLKTDSGMIPRFCAELLDRKAALEEANPSITLTVKVSYLEVYNEKIHDLLVPGNSQLRVREHPVYGPYVVDLSQHSVNSFQELQHWMTIGNKKRAVAATEQNDKSSRSHSLFTVKLTQSFSQVRSDGTWSHDQTRRSQINLVDLAGSERIANSAVSSDRLREGVSINRSLLTLGKVMSALVDKRGFVPYRESVLTWLLKESLGGNSRTCMLATVSPCSSHMDESLSTLRYASQARAIINRVRVNEAPQDKEIRQLREELERLRRAGDRIHTLKEENEDLREQLKERERNHNELEEELNKCKIDLSKTEEMKSQLLKEISDLSVGQSISVPNEEIAKYESEIKNYDRRLNKLQHDYNSVKRDLESLEHKNKQKAVQETEQISVFQEKIKQLKKKLKKSEEDLEYTSANNSALEDKLEMKEIELSSMTKKIKENEKRIIDLERDLRTLEKEFRHLETKLSESKETNNNLLKKIEELSFKEKIFKQDLDQMAALESALNDFESELRKCKDDLFDTRKSKEELEKCKKDLEQKLEEKEKSLLESIEREELLKIKVEKIPVIESDLRLAEAEARKAKRELEEYLSQSSDSDDTNGNELDDTLFQSGNALNDTPSIDQLAENAKDNSADLGKTNSVNDSSYLDEQKTTDEINDLQLEIKLCQGLLKETEMVNDNLHSKLNDVQKEKDLAEENYKKSGHELFQLQEKLINLQEKVSDLVGIEHKLENALHKVSTLESELSRMKVNLQEEKRNRTSLENKLVENNFTVKQLKSKADNAVHLEIELGKCRDDLQKVQRTHLKELAEHKSREEVIKVELALKNQQVEHLHDQLRISQEMQNKIVQENLGLIKVMKKKCNDSEPTKASSHLIEKNIELKKDLNLLKEKLAGKDKQLAESQALLKGMIQHEAKHEEALINAKEKYASEVFSYTMDNAYPHHLNYLIRKARKFTETFKIPYEFELMDKSVIVRHLLLSAKATLSHFQLSNWIDKIEGDKVWSQTMDRSIPWEVDFRDYYDKNIILKPAGDDDSEADSAINCGVQITAAGCINPILWRKTMVKRHVSGIREDSDVLIRYFSETEDSRIYSILSRIKVAVDRLQEATQNVEK